jgi:hypothetical protein
MEIVLLSTAYYTAFKKTLGAVGAVGGMCPHDRPKENIFLARAGSEVFFFFKLCLRLFPAASTRSCRQQLGTAKRQ